MSYAVGVAIMTVVGGWLYSMDGYYTFIQAWAVYAIGGVIALPVLIFTAKQKKAST
jgi:hypothetical protein